MPHVDPERRRSYQREWLAQRRRDWFAENGPCAECGTWDDLQIDHKNASQKAEYLRRYRTNSLWSWSNERRLAELAKCQVLCRSCHSEKTYRCGDNARGSAIGKLTEAEALEAKRAYLAGGVSFKDVGDRFGVHSDTIRYIVNRGGWKHLEATRLVEDSALKADKG